ncbi:hypothetical protein L6164_001442 [Bauhinia variegata]|uniref:Uncharacterized protein n=1 Tax=Bauhinia variegata TaxID=167791 RepID=A0ACB9Q9T5_BAUVA|nr:hypothetical protein L6164_001442 [Bauhinia variegata]
MTYSKVKQLWDDSQHLPNLKRIDLTASDLIEIPDLSTAPNIREINLCSCKSLSQVYSSRFLSKLRLLLLVFSSAVKTVNVGASKVGQRSWRLLAVNEYFKFNYPNFMKVKLEVFKSDSRSNTYKFRVNLVSVPSMTGISRSKSTDTNTNSGSAEHATIKSVLPNLERFRLLDNPSSLGSLSKLFYLELQFGLDYFTTFPELMEATESLCSPSMKRTEIEVVSLRDDLIGLDDSLSQHTFYNCRLSKIPSNNFRLSCLTQVSLYRSDIVTVPASIHCPSRLNSLLSQDYRRTQFTVELTFSLDSEIPGNASEITLNIDERLNTDCQICIAFLGNGLAKIFQCGDSIGTLYKSLFVKYHQFSELNFLKGSQGQDAICTLLLMLYDRDVVCYG